MVHNACGFVDMDFIRNDKDIHEEPNEDANKFYELLEDTNANLYPNCKNISKLSFIVTLLHLKCLNHWNDTSMDILLRLFKKMLPEGALVPNLHYAKVYL